MKFLKSDFIIVLLCLLSLFIWVGLLNNGSEWAIYCIYGALVYPAYVFVVMLTYAIHRTFFKRK